MDRNKLTEMLLGCEVSTRFVSIKEAMEAGIKGEPAAIEAALMEWAWGKLHRVLPPYAAKHGCWLEIQDRRGAGIVGILLRVETEGTSWQMVEWLDDLDGETAIDAWQMVVAHGGVDN